MRRSMFIIYFKPVYLADIYVCVYVYFHDDGRGLIARTKCWLKMNRSAVYVR